MRRALGLATGLVVVVAIAGGCAYRVGTLLPEHIKTVAVPVFVNKTAEPNIEMLATNAVVNRLAVDGTLKVVPESEADVILRVDLVGYERKAIRYASATRPDEYRITVTVAATLYDTRDNENLWENVRLSGNTKLAVGSGLPAAERRARPEAFEDLAHDIVEQVVEGW